MRTGTVRRITGSAGALSLLMIGGVALWLAQNTTGHSADEYA